MTQTKKLNPWMEHVRKMWLKLKPKGKSYKECLQEAKKTYKKKEPSK